MTDRTYCEGGGGVTMWRSPPLVDGTSATPFWHSAGDVLFLVDVGIGRPWLIRNTPGKDYSMAPVPNVGALATILSALVEGDSA